MNPVQVQDQHLAVAERHVANGEQRLIWQRELVAHLEQTGQSTKRAVELLRVFEATQFELIAKRDSIREELAANSWPLPQVA